MTPVNNPLSHLVYASNGSYVSHVWVGGTPVLTDGELQTLDLALIRNRAQYWQANFRPSQPQVVVNENVDDLEIRKFEALASRWWDPNSEFKPLHDINPLRVNYISQHINLAEKRVLDIGCGGGILAEALAHHGAAVTAIDKAEASLSVAKLHC